MNNHPSETFCILPWIHLFIGNTGEMKPCCISKSFSNNHNINIETISDFQYSNDMKTFRLQLLQGKKPEICNRCWYQEASENQNSERLSQLDYWGEYLHFNSIINSPEENFIRSIDIRPGNKCNLKCIMCGPTLSSKWLEDKSLLNLFEHTKISEENLNHVNWADDLNFWEYLYQQSENLQKINFAGGEPLISNKHYNFLCKLVDSDRAKNISLKYNTNTTIDPSRFIDLWSKFKHVDVGCSIDAVGSLNEFIRYPSNWDDILKVLQILDTTPDNIRIKIHSAIGALNVNYIPEMYRFFVRQQYQKIGKQSINKEFTFSLTPIQIPNYLNMQVLSENEKQKITQKLKTHLTECNDTHQQNVQFIIYFLNNRSLYDLYYPTFITFINSLIQTRGNKYPYEIPK